MLMKSCVTGLINLPSSPRRIGFSAQFPICEPLLLRNNHFIYRLSLTTRRFVLDFLVPLNRVQNLCEEPMRLLRSYCPFMTTVRPIIRSSDRADLRACGSRQQAKEPVTGFTGPE
jgi:hypothetical protein